MQRKNRKCDDSFAVINTSVVIVYRHFNEAFRDERCRDLEAVNTLPDGSFKSLYEGQVTTVSCPSSIKCNKRDKSCWHWVCMKKSLPKDLLTTGDARRDTSKSPIIRCFKIHVIHSTLHSFTFSVSWSKKKKKKETLDIQLCCVSEQNRIHILDNEIICCRTQLRRWISRRALERPYPSSLTPNPSPGQSFITASAYTIHPPLPLSTPRRQQ